MNLGYQKVREFSTADLPLVITNIDMIFGFTTSPNYQTVIDLQKLTTQGSEDEELVRLSSLVMSYVQTPDGEKYGLNSVEAIEVFVQETDIELLRSVIVSWFVLVFSEIEATKKKSAAFLNRSNVNGEASRQAEALSSN